MSDGSDDDFAVLLGCSVVGSRPPTKPGEPGICICGSSAKRSKLEHGNVRSKMREAKAKLRNAASSQALIGECSALVAVATRNRRVVVSPKHGVRRTLGKLAKAVALKLQGRFMGKADELEIAFHTGTKVANVAKATGVSADTLVSTRKLVSLNCMRMTLAYLKRYRQLCPENKPRAVLHLRKYDSCSFYLNNPVQLPMLGVIKGSQSARPIHTLVQRRLLIMIWDDKAIELSYPVPTLATVSADCNCLQQALDAVPQVRDVQDAVIDILTEAEDVSCEFDGSDGAYSNIKYQAWQELTESRFARESESRGNHDTHVTTTSLEKFLGVDMVSLLTALIVLLRTGGFFLRLISSLVPAILHGIFLDKCSLPGCADRSLLKLLRSHSLYHHKRMQQILGPRWCLFRESAL